MPSSRETIAAWQVIPPESVTIAAERRISGTQSGAVMWVTRISPSPKLLGVGEAHARRGRGRLLRRGGAEAADEHLTIVFDALGGRAAGGGHRPRLQHP